MNRHELHSYQDFRKALKAADAKESMFKSDLAKSFGGQRVRDVADSYAASKGIKLDHNLPNHQIVPEHSAKIAQAYADMKHDPSHPDVKRAYDAMINETTDQFRHVMKSGLKISRITPGMENPYKGGSKDLIHDIHNNNHMWYYPTESGFGSTDASKDHPLLKPTEETHGGHKLLANDLFRVVHDYFGHAKEGHSFGPRGEDNAWKHHSQMYSPEARRALTSETRGQNSWVNFGPHGEHNRKNPEKTVFAEQKAGLLPEWASHHPDLPSTQESSKMKKNEKIDSLRKYGREELASRLEKHIEDVAKGQDENGNPIRGSNKRLQQAKVFGKPSDIKTDKKGVAHPNIPDANGQRTSPQRQKMMGAIKNFAENRYGVEMTVAEGKRDSSGKLKNKASIEKEPYQVFDKDGAKKEKARNAKIKAINASKPKGEKPIKRIDPKPDWRSGKLETQPSPDAAIHEISHLEQAPKGMGIKHFQEHMDKEWGESQKKHGHMQQKKTAGEIQPMAGENKIRRQIGLPANRATKPTDKTKPVAQAIDGSGPRFVRGKDSQGKPADLDRQTRLLSPENKERHEKIADGSLKFHPEKGWSESHSVNAKINSRKEQPKSTKPAMPQKLAASESAKDLEKGWSSSKKYGVKPKVDPEVARAQHKKAMDAAVAAMDKAKAVSQAAKAPKKADTIAAPKAPKKPEAGEKS